MALQVFDGYDHYGSHSDLVSRSGFLQYQEGWTGTVGVISFGTGRNGFGECMQLGSSFNNGEFAFVFGQRVASAFVGMALNLGTTSNACGAIFRFYNSIDSTATPQVTIYFNESNYAIQIYRGDITGTLLYASPNNVWSRSTWNFTEMWPVINSSTGSVKVYINETLEASITGVNTQSQADASWDVMTVELTPTGISSAPRASIDDFYYADTTTGPGLIPCNVPLGDCKVDTLFATGNASVQWTPLANTNWQEVSEVSFDGDVSYNFSSTPGNEDLLNFQSLDALTITVIGVQLTGAYRKTDAGARTLKQALKSGATKVYGTTRSVPDSYNYWTDLFILDPNTSANWTPTNVNAVSGGYNLVS